MIWIDKEGRMPLTMRASLRGIVAACLMVFSVQATAQSAGAPLSSISEETFFSAVSLIRPTPDIKKLGDSYDLTLPNGLSANAELQNCDDKKTLSNCRTLSIIVNLQHPAGKSRADLLSLANELNSRDISGRTFVDDKGDMITRFAFFVTGHENARSLATKLINWDAFVRSAVLSLYGNGDSN